MSESTSVEEDYARRFNNNSNKIEELFIYEENDLPTIPEEKADTVRSVTCDMNSFREFDIANPKRNYT